MSYLLLSLPIAWVCAIWLGLRLRRKGRLDLVVLAVPGEFAQFVKHMESLRRFANRPMTNEIVIPLSKWRHEPLSELYADELGTRVIWGGGFSGLLQQAMLVLPKGLVNIVRDDSRLKAHPYEFPTEPIAEPVEFAVHRGQLLSNLKLSGKPYVAMAVYTRAYDFERNPKYAEKSKSVESVGDELAPAIDFLESQEIGLILLGSSDTGLAKLPRPILRLQDFTGLGGVEEVVLAAGCSYFWTDNVGAWWLGQPFQRPVLFSNMAAQGCRKGLMPQNHIVLPVRYQTLDGKLLTFREMYRMKNTSLYKAATRGEVRLIRNDPTSIINAHREMISRLSGTWREDEESAEFQRRYDELLLEFPRLHRLQIPSSFLRAHPELLN
jgi:putative glycosyltransferase (TIGR04372 family)